MDHEGKDERGSLEQISNRLFKTHGSYLPQCFSNSTVHMNHLGMFEIHIHVQWVQEDLSFWVANKPLAMSMPPSWDHTLSSRSLEYGGKLLEGAM